MRKKLVAANWKMNTGADSGPALAEAIVKGLGNETRVDVLLCPPFPFLIPVGEKLRDSSVELGAQDCYFEDKGAFTGEVSPVMLREVGCTTVILGHSERRHILGESDALVNRKVKAALRAGLRVILCVGETLHERLSDEWKTVVLRQLTAGVEHVPDDLLPNIMLAYEPVWAIGTGHNATPEQAQEVHAFLRGKVASLVGKERAERGRILYGGSVKGKNAADLLQQPDVDGGLIGGASLDASEFLAIATAALPR
jgi:triosephosphate isomerase (TIM)